MSWFNNRSIRTKLLGSFIAVVALLGVATGFAILAIQQAVDDMGEMHDTHLKGVVAVGEAEQAVQASAAVTLEALVADSPAASAAIVTEASSHLTVAKAKLAEFRATQSGADVQVLIDQLSAQVDAFGAAQKPMFDLIVAGDIDGAMKMKEEGSGGAPSVDAVEEATLKALGDTTLAGPDGGGHAVCRREGRGRPGDGPGNPLRRDCGRRRDRPWLLHGPDASATRSGRWSTGSRASRRTA